MDPVSTDGLIFTAELLRRDPPAGIDVVSGLQHFAIVTYAIPPERLRPHVHPRFDLECITGSNGEPLALVSMVPFMDDDFHFQRVPFPRFRFGQTNYRAYVIDRKTGRRAAWFFGTSLDSWTVAVPHRVWKLPWHRAHIEFDCQFDEAAGRYSHYRMSTASAWAPVALELEDSGKSVESLMGFPDLEAGEVTLTHPLDGAYCRRDGRLGSYRVWHDRLKLTEGKVLAAHIGLFDRLGLVPFAEQSMPHSVLIQRRTEFTIYLPPRLLRE